MEDRALSRVRDLPAAMFGLNAAGRLAGPGPHLHVVRTGTTVLSVAHEDVSDDLASRLMAIADRQRGRPTRWACDYADYISALSAFAPLHAVRTGPLYAFADNLDGPDDAVSLTAENAGLLKNGLQEWLPDVAAGLPMRVAVVEGRAVSVCASVAASVRVHCAGVETVPGHRGRGHASKCTLAWARAVRRLGAEPFYATTFDNLASQRLAAALRLRLVGCEFSITCRRP